MTTLDFAPLDAEPPLSWDAPDPEPPWVEDWEDQRNDDANRGAYDDIDGWGQ